MANNMFDKKITKTINLLPTALFATFLAGTLLNTSYAGSTIYNTILDGNWSDPLTWEGGNIPASPLPKDTIVNLKHNISYDVAGGLDLSKGVLNVKGILNAGNHTIVLTEKDGQLNVNGGLILLGNGNVEANDGNINLSSGGIQLCNGSYTDTGAKGLFGSGYVFSAAGNITAKKADNFSSRIDWCALGGTGTNLPTAQNCAEAQPPGGCTDTTHYLSMAPIPPSCSAQQLSNTQTFQPGAYIIDMGVEPQTFENGIKPYGLIYDLVVNHQIPVYWSINTSKTKDGIDFSHNGKDYKSSSFIIPQDYATAAAATISTWKTKGVVVDGPTSSSFDAPIYDVISSVPNAVLDTANGGIIEKAFYEPSEIPSSSYKTGTPNDVQACDDIFVLPHADPQKDWDSGTASNFEDFVKHGGFLWAGCRAPSGVENSNNGGMGLHLLSATGLMDHGDHGKASPDSGDPDDFTYLSCAAIDPPMQFLGRVDNALSGGSEDVYLPEGNWRDTTTVSLFDPDQEDLVSGNASGTAAIVAYGRAEGKSNKGMVLYEASHSIQAGSEAENVAAARIFGNFLLMAGIDNKIEIKDSNLDTSIIAGADNSFSVNAPAATSFNWISSCGGTFTPVASGGGPGDNISAVTFHAPATIGASGCSIRVVLEDACGRKTIVTGATVINTTPTIIDYGDAPASYGDASHTIASNALFLGSVAPDDESNSQNAANSGSDGTGDDNDASDDEDAISTFPTLYDSDTSYTIPAASIPLTNTSGSSATLYGFIDFNRDGDFDDIGERTTASVINNGVQPDTDLVWNNPTVLSAGMTYARFRLSTETGLTASSAATDGEVEDYTLDITAASVCTALTGEVNEAVVAPQHLQLNEKVFVASSSVEEGSKQGHLRAYAIQSNGAPSGSASWDAATTMTTHERSDRLFSTGNDGGLVAFSELDDNAFNMGALPFKSKVIEFTLTPSVDGGIFLDGRADGSFLGSISSDSSITQISRQTDTWAYLQDTSYRSFYKSTIASRTGRVLVTSDDGFLYAFDESDGDLAWGWMPRSLVYDLTEFQSFQDKGLMQGHIDLLDLKDATNVYASYIVGSYKSGLGQFVLKLDSGSTSKSDPEELIWDVDETRVNALAESSPNYGKRAYFSDNNGKVYAAYIISADSASYLKIRNLTDATDTRSIQLNYMATSTPYVITDFSSASAPASKTLYLGDSTGNIYSTPLLSSGALDSNINIGNALNGAAVAAMDTSTTSAVLYIGAASSSSGGYYLRAQTQERLTIFQYQSSQWERLWTSYAGGAGKWSNDTYSADNTIASLPSTAQIEDEAVIVGDAIVLPVSTAPTGTSCYRNAYYYLYRLTNGQFPSNRFFNSDNTVISDPITIGRGKPEKLILSDFAQDKLMGFGVSDQKSNGSVGINKSLYIKDEMTTGIRSWRELRE